MTFSKRHGLSGPYPEITVREDAPFELRNAIFEVAHANGMDYRQIRQTVCRILRASRNTGNYTDDAILEEISDHIFHCQWHKVYDVAEALYGDLRARDHQEGFTEKLNEVFRENGIGWQMLDGKIQHRGSDAFTFVAKRAPDDLKEAGLPKAAQEMREAISDISRRPRPDISGAVQHATTALEATIKRVTGQQKRVTLGQVSHLLSSLGIKRPLDDAVKKMWGYASNEARHGSEESALEAAEAELIVVVAGAICQFIATKSQAHRPPPPSDDDPPF